MLLVFTLAIEKSNILLVRPRRNFFLFRNAKIRDKFRRNIYNFEFHS